MSSTAQSATGVRAVMQDPSFRRLWLAQFVSVFGDFLALFAVISLITFRWHGSAAQVTYLLISYMLPMGIVGPIAGVFVDRWNAKRVMIGSDVIRAALSLSLVWVTDLPHLCAIFVAMSIVSSFFAPAQSVAVRTIVVRERLLAANSMMSQAFYTVRLLSPVIAGALVSWLTEISCFYLDSFSFVFSAVMVGTIVIVRPTTSGERSLKGFLADLTSGNRFIFTHPDLAFVITAMLSAMFVISCLSPLFSIYVRDILHSGTFMYGVVSSAVGVGLIVGTQIVNRFVEVSRKAIVLAGLAISGVGVALLGIFGVVYAAIATTFLMGFGIAFVIVSSQTLMQQETPHDMMGRVSSSFMSVFSFAQVLGLVLSGYLAVWLGIRQVFLACAVTLAALAVAGTLRHRATSAGPAMPVEAEESATVGEM